MAKAATTALRNQASKSLAVSDEVVDLMASLAKALGQVLEQTETVADRPELPVRRPLKRPPTHPGEFLREDVLPALKINVTQAARELGISRVQLHRILAGEAPITPETAVRIGHWAGNGGGIWLRLQQAFDLWHAEKALADDLKAIPARGAA